LGHHENASELRPKFVRSCAFSPLNPSKHWLPLVHAADTIAALGGKVGEIWI